MMFTNRAFSSPNGAATGDNWAFFVVARLIGAKGEAKKMYQRRAIFKGTKKAIDHQRDGLEVTMAMTLENVYGW